MPTFKKIFDRKIGLKLEKEIDYIGRKTEKLFFYRCEYKKTGIAKFLSHLDLIKVIERAIRRAKIPLLYSKGFHPKMLISYSPALPLGMEGKKEILEFRSNYFIEKKEFLNQINKFLPDGIKFLNLIIISPEKKMQNAIKRFCYSFNINEKDVKQAISKIKEEMNLKNLSDFEVHSKIINKIKAENELIERIDFKNNKIYFYIKFNQEKQLKIQRIIEKYYKIENSSFLIAREKIFIEN